MTRAPAHPAKAELRALTGIRGIAAWLVVLYHARTLMVGTAPAWLIEMLAKGYLAVDLFFMLSGFVMWYNYGPQFGRVGLAASGPFLWRRLARIWPLHGFILAAMCAFALALLLTGRDHGAYPFAELPLHVLLVQNWGFTADLAWNHPAWSISTELAAYILFPALAVCAVWDRRGTPVLIGSLALILAALHAVFVVSGESSLGGQIARLGLIRCIFEFTAGTVLCALWQRWRDLPAAPSRCRLAVLAVLAAGMLARPGESAFVPALFAALLLVLALDRGPVDRLLSRPLPHWLGEVSYSTYLVHFFLLVLFKIAFVDASLRMGWAQLAGYLLLVLAASAALYHGVEKPAQRWINRHMPERLHRPGQATARS